MFKILQLGYFALLIILWALLLAKCPNRFFSASEKDLELTALKILSKNLRWILWLICLPNIQPPQTRELSERPFFNMNTLRIVSGYVTNFHKPGNKVILLHVPESYINATTMSKWQAALSSINYMHITNIHHHRITTNKLNLLYVLYQLEKLTTKEPAS